MNKQQRKEKFLKEYPDHDILKGTYIRKYPFLTIREAKIAGLAKRKSPDWLEANHIEIFNKVNDHE